MKIDLQQVLDTLKAEKALLQRHKVRSLAVFGSVARGEAHGDSDIDLLVEFAEPVGLFEFARLQRALEQVLGRRVDLVTPAALRDSMREDVMREAVRAA